MRSTRTRRRASPCGAPGKARRSAAPRSNPRATRRATRRGGSSTRYAAGRELRALVDVRHRIRTDAGRLTGRWFEDVLAGGLAETAYVELVAVVTMVAGGDYFARALAMPPLPLPEPLPGAPSRRRPAAARPA